MMLQNTPELKLVLELDTLLSTSKNYLFPSSVIPQVPHLSPQFTEMGWELDGAFPREGVQPDEGGRAGMEF